MFVWSWCWCNSRTNDSDGGGSQRSWTRRWVFIITAKSLSNACQVEISLKHLLKILGLDVYNVLCFIVWLNKCRFAFRFLLDHVVYLPVNKFVPYSELDKIVTALKDSLSKLGYIARFQQFAAHVDRWLFHVILSKFLADLMFSNYLYADVRSDGWTIVDCSVLFFRCQRLSLPKFVWTVRTTQYVQ